MTADKPFILDPSTGFKLMEHLDVHHQDEEPTTRMSARELKAYHQKLHNLTMDATHTHRRPRREA